MHALKEYQEVKEPERLQMLQLLLENGAGIGLNLGSILHEYPEIVGSLRQIVILGGSCSPVRNVEFIQTLAEFTEKIDRKEYPKWEKILQQALDSNSFSNNITVNNLINNTLHYVKLARTNTFNPNNNNNTNINENNTTQFTRPPSQNSTSKSKDINTNSNITIGLTSTQINSPIHAARVAHDNLLDDIEPIINTHRESFKPFHDSIMGRNYTQALRRACTSTHPKAFDLIKTLCDYKDKLHFDINEPNREQKYTALHFAAQNSNTEIYTYLISIGANPNAKADANKAGGKTPTELREENKLAGHFSEKLNI